MSENIDPRNKSGQVKMVTGFIELLLKHYPDAIYGPAHAILADGNMGDILIKDTIEDCHRASGGQCVNGIDYIAEGHNFWELESTAVTLSMLLLYDEDSREEGWEMYYG
jgi:hypothetical protein